VIVGAGVAGLEALLALRAVLGDRVDLTIVAPEVKFTNASMAVPRSSTPARVRGLPLRDVATDLAARWHRDELDRVEADRHVIVTRDRTELRYDSLVLALGARSEREWRSRGVLTYHGRRDTPAYRLLLRELREGRVKSVAFVKPGGASWPLPLYDLALATAFACAAEGSGAELSLVTPEEEPLDVFGAGASAAIRGLLEECEIALHTGSHGVPSRPGRLHISPGNRRLAVDRIVTLPRLVGPRVRGIPQGGDGFIDTDPHGRVLGLGGVYAAGDVTAFPIKQGGLAAQQADAVAEAIAADAGADIDPHPFMPVLRGLLLTGGAARYLRAPVSSSSGESLVSEDALWWPPNRLCGRYLAPYLSSRAGFAADVMPHGELSVPVETPLGSGEAFGELRDLPPRSRR
jgi:sulfide:quinone oxidoreductase